MRFMAGLILGLFAGLAIYRAPHATAFIWTSNPPADAADYPGPRMRRWRHGMEVFDGQS